MHAGQYADASRRDLADARAGARRRAARRVPRARRRLRAHGAHRAHRRPDGARRRRGRVRRDRDRAASARSTRSPATPFNVNSSKQLGTVLFEELKLPIVSHTKTGWSTSIEALERIEHAHPIVRARAALARCCAGCATTGSTRCGAASTPTGACTRGSIRRARSRGSSSTRTPISGACPGRTPEMARDPPRVRRARRAACSCRSTSTSSACTCSRTSRRIPRSSSRCAARRHAPPHRRRGAREAAGGRHARRAPARQGRQLRDVRRAGRERARAAARRLGGGSEGVHRALRSPLRARCARSRTSSCGSRTSAGYIVTIAGRHWPIGGLESLDSAASLVRRAPGAPRDARGLGARRLAPRAARRRSRVAARRARRRVPVLQVLDEVLFDVPEAELDRRRARLLRTRCGTRSSSRCRSSSASRREGTGPTSSRSRSKSAVTIQDHGQLGHPGLKPGAGKELGWNHNPSPPPAGSRLTRFPRWRSASPPKADFSLIHPVRSLPAPGFSRGGPNPESRSVV